MKWTWTAQGNESFLIHIRYIQLHLTYLASQPLPKMSTKPLAKLIHVGLELLSIMMLLVSLDAPNHHSSTTSTLIHDFQPWQNRRVLPIMRMINLGPEINQDFSNARRTAKQEVIPIQRFVLI